MTVLSQSASFIQFRKEVFIGGMFRSFTFRLNQPASFNSEKSFTLPIEKFSLKSLNQPASFNSEKLKIKKSLKLSFNLVSISQLHSIQKRVEVDYDEYLVERSLNQPASFNSEKTTPSLDFFPRKRSQSASFIQFRKVFSNSELRDILGFVSISQLHSIQKREETWLLHDCVVEWSQSASFIQFRKGISVSVFFQTVQRSQSASFIQFRKEKGGRS